MKKEFNCNVKVIDFNTEIHKSWDHCTERDFNKWFKESLIKITSDGFNPDLVGFSSLFITGYKNVLCLANIAKEIFPNAFRICGGNVPTTM